MNLELFGHQIPIRTHFCSFFNSEPSEVVEPYLNIFVRFKGCNAKCKFCEYADTANKFNEDKFLHIIDEVKKKIYIKKVAFTGGEPTLNFNHFKHIVKITDEKLKSAFVLNTNGYNLRNIVEDDFLSKRLDSISISRHHYNDDINNQILGFESVSSDDLKEFQLKVENKKLLHLSCNLIKDYIDSKEEIYKFLNYTSKIGIKSAGIISLMPINDFCKNNFVDINLIDLLDDKLNKIKEYSYKDVCCCKNYIYITDNARIVRVYYKNTYKPSDIIENLVFDGEYLRVGFSEEIIF